MRTIYILFLGLLIFGCNQNKENALREDSKDVIEQPKEPTKPEETEVYKPVPPSVNPIGQNGAPSDAIVLFDGENLNSWEHSRDTRPAEWFLNADRSALGKRELKCLLLPPMHRPILHKMALATQEGWHQHRVSLPQWDSILFSLFRLSLFLPQCRCKKRFKIH